MSEQLLFLTGKLAEKSLHRVLQQLQPSQPWQYRIHQIGVSVAALMTPQLIARRLPSTGDAQRMILPGLCQGDLSLLEQKYGIPVERGPIDLKDLPQYFGRGGKAPDLSGQDVMIFAEIVEAPQLNIEQILARARHYQQQGADVIDLGCLPGVPFPHLAEAIQSLKAAGYRVSVDSLDSRDLLLAGKHGADFLLSLNEKTLWIADEVPSVPVLIPARPRSLPSLYRAIEAMQNKGLPFIADPILDPIPFGFAESIVRYHKLRKRYPDIAVMMGVGNLTELTDADTTGINAMLFGVITELKLNAVLTTAVSAHASQAVAEADQARRIMYAAREDGRLPRGYSDALLALHDRRPFPYSADEIAELATTIKDPSFRIQVSSDGIHIYNRDGEHVATDPFELYPHLGVADDASHAFYLGVELARAQIAWQLKKRYSQDEPLSWGCSAEALDAAGKVAHRDASLQEQRARNKEKG